MQQIKMRDELLSKIFNGEKTATTRMGIKMYHVGYVEFIGTESKRTLGPYLIDKIELLHWDDIDDELAKKEGYNHAGELKKALEDIYDAASIWDMTKFTVVHFFPC